MIRKKIYFFLLLASCVGFLTSCAINYDDGVYSTDTLQLKSPYDTQWRFVGFGPATTNASDIFSAVKVEWNTPMSYHLMLKKDNTFTGYTTTNKIDGEYTINVSSGAFSFRNINTTKIPEVREGDKYVNCLKSVYSYEVYNRNLKLYYSFSSTISSTIDKKTYLLYEAVR